MKKISNQDIIRLAEIKSYFMDPPYTFKIASYAKPQVEEALGILRKYKFVSPVIITQMEDVQVLLQQSEHDMNATMEHMRTFAVLLNRANR